MNKLIDFEIYQIKDNDDGHYMRFNSLSAQAKYGYNVDISKYDCMYSGKREGANNPFQTLENIYEEFNLNRPSDFKGHSLSVSDVVVLNNNGSKAAYYCDSIGFKEIPDFFIVKKEPIKSMIKNAEARKDDSKNISQNFSKEK